MAVDHVSRKIRIIDAGLDLGGRRRGTGAGPIGMRIAGMSDGLSALGHQVSRGGAVDCKDFALSDVGDVTAKHLDDIVASCSQLRDFVAEALAVDETPLVLGGDHSVACGTVAGVSQFAAARSQAFGLLWFDAHGDMNTPKTSPTGNVHGMPLAAILGKEPAALAGIGASNPMVDATKTVLFGIRDLDDLERETIKTTGCRAITMREIDVRGMSACVDEALDIVSDETLGFHLSFDLDGCDPSIAPGVGTPVPGGTNLRESHLLMEEVAMSQKLLSLEFTEVNPILDVSNQTAELAVALAESAFGRRILD